MLIFKCQNLQSIFPDLLSPFIYCFNCFCDAPNSGSRIRAVTCHPSMHTITISIIHYNIILRPHISHHTQVRVSRNEIHLQHIHYLTLHYITIITPTWNYYSNNKSSHQVLYNPHLLYNYFKQYGYNIKTHSDLLVNKHLTGEIPSTFPQRLIRTYHLA